MTEPKGPVLFEGAALRPAEHRVDQAPPVPDPAPPQGAAMQRATRIAARRGSGIGRLVFWSLLGLLGMALGVAAWDFVVGLLGRNIWLGRVALALAGIAAAGVVLFVLREIAGFARLARIDAIQRRAADPAARRDRAAAVAVTGELLTLYAAREELRLPAEELRHRQAEILDADALLAQAETRLLGPLDIAARREVEAAARQVAAATALVPLALADVVVALASNIRMVRRIAEVYGGRAGTIGSWRLLRAVASHLIATGAVAVGDDMISSVAGGGMLAKVSRRFGEGVVNGALTARVGIAAMEVCRPMPFRALPRPRVTRLLSRALTGLWGNEPSG